MKDENYGLRKAIARSQLYEKDEEYIRTDMMKDVLNIEAKARQERKLLRPYSPLSRQQATNEDDENGQVRSLTGTGVAEKRPSLNKRSQEKTDEKN